MKQRRRSTAGWLVVALAAWTADAFASDSAPPRLPLENAVERALAHYPSILAARAEHAAAAARAGGSRAERRPAVSLLGTTTRFAEPMVVTPIHGFDLATIPEFDDTLIQTTAEASYTLFDGGGRAARMREADALAESALLGAQAQEQIVVALTVSTYVEVLGLGEALAAHDRRLAALEAELSRVRQRLEVGRAAEVERLRMEAALAAAAAERVRLETSLDTAERDLARWIGGDPEETRADGLVPLRLREESAGERPVLAERAMAASPAVEQARRATAAADAAVALARSAHSPEVRLIGSFVEYGSAAGDFSGEWSAGARVVLPVYRGGATRRRVEAAEAARAAAEERLRLTVVQVAGQVDRALAGVAESGARVESLERAVASFEEVVRIEKLRLDVGSGVQTDYLDAEADLLAARADLAQARHRRIAWRAELARATGELGLEWVRRSVEALP